MDELRSQAEPLLKDLSWLRALARRLVRDPDLAEDAVQETLVKAMTRRPRSATSLRAWLGSVLRNEVRQEQRSRARRADREARLERADTAPPTAEIVAELALQKRLVELVQELKEPYRTAIALRFLRGRTPRQIARELDVPVKTVHSRIERGLAQLRVKLDREYGDRSAWALVLAPLIQRGGLGLALGSLVIPMHVKLIAAAAGVVALGALATLPFRSRPEPVQHAARPAQDADAAGLAGDELDDGQEPVVADLGQRQAEAAPATEQEAAPAALPIVFEGFVREMDGRTVPGVQVVFEAEHEGNYRRSSTARGVVSGADGSFSFLLPEETGRLTVESDLYASVSRPYLEGVLPGETPVVVVAPRRVYAGRVVDEAGQPLENALVEVTLDGSWIQSHSVGESPLHLLLPFGEERTNAFGEFHFDGLGFVEGAHVVATRDGYMATRADLAAESELELELVLTRETLEQPAVYGRVVDANGNGVADAEVSLGWTSVRSGSDGRFALELEWVKSGYLRAVKPGHLPASVPFDRAAGDGADPERPLVLYLGDRPLSIRGRVLDGNGEPAPGVAVFTPDTTHFGQALIETGEDSTLGEVTVEELLTGTAGPGNGWRRLETVTDEQGDFELTGLLERDYALFAISSDLSAVGPVLVSAGSGGVELVLEEGEPRRVAGRVISQGGVPLAGVRVSAGRGFEWQQSPERLADSWTNSVVRPPDAARLFDENPVLTDAEGRFELKGVSVSDGAFLSVRAASILFGGGHTFSTTDDLEDLEIVVEARCDFRVVLDDPAEADAVSHYGVNGEPNALYVQVEDKRISMPNVEFHDGRTGVMQLGEGERTLVLFKDGEEVRRCEVTLVPGEVQEVRL